MKKKSRIIVFFLTVSTVVLIMITNSQIVFAGDTGYPNGVTGPSPLGTLGSNPNVTFVNNDGLILSGPRIEAKNIVPLIYYGNKLEDDVTVGHIDPKQPQSKYSKGDIISGKIVRIKNVGYYNGDYLTIAMEIGAHARLNFVNGGIVPDQSFNYYPSSTSYEIWIEGSKGNKIDSEELTVMLPTNLAIPKITSTPQYRQYDYMNEGVSNLIVRKSTSNDLIACNNLLFGQTSINYYENGYTYQKSNMFVSVNNISQIGVTMNTLYKPVSGHFVIKAGVYNGTYPNGKYSNSRTDSIDSIQFFTADNKFLLPLSYSEPSVIDTYNETTYQAEIDISQPVFEQGKDLFYPSDGLTVTTTIPEIVDRNSSNNHIMVKDKNGNDLTSQVSLKVENGGYISYKIPKSLLVSLGNNVITLTGMLDLPPSARAITSYSKDGIVTLPVTAQNSDSVNHESTGKAEVKVPVPTGTPITQTVYQGVQTENLDATQFVKDLKSSFSDDLVKVVGFEQNKIFSTVGNDTALVKIQSELTGAQAVITVPVIVQEKPKENALLTWQSSVTGSKDKKEIVDKSIMKETIEEKMTWETNLTNREYSISVRNLQGKEVAEKALETNGTKINEPIDISVDLPTNQLNYGNNQFVVGIYVKDESGKATGSPLDTITLTITVEGSLKIVSVPDTLNWTNRLVSRGILERDKGNTMEIKVVDTRNLSDNQKNWTVSAQSKLVTNQTVPFDLVWKKDSSSNISSLTEKQVVLTSSEAEKSQDFYSKKWDEETGVQLNAGNDLKEGNYSNKVVINWTLYNTAKIE